MRTLARLLALLGVSGSACGELPGEIVGTYKITMKLEENTCGAESTHLLDGHHYRVELRSEDERAYWRVPGQRPIEGRYQPPNFRFEYSAIVANEGADAGPRGCTLKQVDVLTGKLTELPDAGTDEAEDAGDVDADADEELDAGLSASAIGEYAQDAGGDGDPAMRGEHTFSVSAVPGTDCATALEPRGRFVKLPCLLRYSLRGETTKPF